MTVSQVRQEIRDLKRLTRYLLAIFVLSILVPIPLAALTFYNLENASNTGVRTYWNALEYASDVALGTRLTNATALTFQGKLLSSLLAVLKLVFFGFISSIILTCIQIYIKQSELDYLRGLS